jgi:hypothetical protein
LWSAPTIEPPFGRVRTLSGVPVGSVTVQRLCAGDAAASSGRQMSRKRFMDVP